MSLITVSKTDFKPKAFEYLRKVERQKATVQLTNHGRPVAEIVPYRLKSLQALEEMRGLVRKYQDPLEPAGGKWDVEP